MHKPYLGIKPQAPLATSTPIDNSTGTLGVEIINHVPLGAVVAFAVTAGVLIATAVAGKRQRLESDGDTEV